MEEPGRTLEDREEEELAAKLLVGEDGESGACLMFGLIGAQQQSVRSFADTAEKAQIMLRNSCPRTFEEVISGPRSLPPEMVEYLIAKATAKIETEEAAAAAAAAAATAAGTAIAGEEEDEEDEEEDEEEVEG